MRFLLPWDLLPWDLLPWDYHEITMRLPWDYHEISGTKYDNYRKIKSIQFHIPGIKNLYQWKRDTCAEETFFLWSLQIWMHHIYLDCEWFWKCQEKFMMNLKEFVTSPGLCDHLKLFYCVLSSVLLLFNSMSPGPSREFYQRIQTKIRPPFSLELSSKLT